MRHQVERNDWRVFAEIIELNVKKRFAAIKYTQIAEDGGFVEPSVVIS